MASDYLKRRLERFVQDGLLKAHTAVGKARGEAARHVPAGSNRMHQLCDQAAGQVLQEYLQRMAKVAYEVDGTSDVAVQRLDEAGTNLAEAIAVFLQSMRRTLRDPAPPVDASRAKLLNRVHEAVDDFRHGMVGEEALKKASGVNIVTHISNSTGTIVQNAVGEHNRQSAEQRSLLAALDDLVNSKEYAALEEEERAAVKDTVDVLRDEIQKPNAEPSKVARWGARLIELLTQLGLRVLADQISKHLFVP